MRVIICGSRDWNHPNPIYDTLEGLMANYPERDIIVIHGDARGADRLAGQVARALNLTVEPYPADWDAYGKSAGPRRNKQMLDTGADLVVAFKQGFDTTLKTGGTENMIKIARAANVPNVVHTEPW